MAKYNNKRSGSEEDFYNDIPDETEEP